MINYRSFAQSPVPAFSRLETDTPYQFPGSHADVYKSLAVKQAAERGIARNQALTDFENEKLAAQQNSALTGLQNLIQARQQGQDLANSQNAMSFGAVNSLLSGLYR